VVRCNMVWCGVVCGAMRCVGYPLGSGGKRVRIFPPVMRLCSSISAGGFTALSKGIVRAQSRDQICPCDSRLAAREARRAREAREAKEVKMTRERQEMMRRA
jgi:hypothetical protein